MIATRTGGVAEVVTDGENGLVVEPEDVDALAAAIERFFADAGARGAAARERRGVGRGLLGGVDLRPARGDPARGRAVNPRVLFVGRTRYRLPLEGPLAAKWDALSERLDLRVLASGTGSDPRFRLFRPRPLEGPLFYATLPARVARELRAFDPDAVVAESAFEAVACVLALGATRSRAKLVVEVHGDWRTSTRLYGSRARAALGPVADRLATWAIRRADARSRRLGVHRVARPRRRPRAGRRLHRVHGPRRVRRPGRAGAGGAARALRRRARAVQERRGARGRVARGRARGCRRRGCT